MSHPSPLAEASLSDRYTRRQGRVYLTGTQALVRVVLDQARRDREAGLETRGYVSGYRGSPLGAVDQEMARQRPLLDAAGVECHPAVNEEFGATQMIGTQQVETDPDKTCLAVFGLWYGKGPGVDRAADALKHGNAYGSSPRGGVLVVAGDDHGCVSSSMPHQSDVAFMNFFMPTIHPANVAEFLPFAEWGYALSRFSGMWVGFKAISEVVESGMSFDLPADRRFATPDFTPPPGGLHYRWPDLPGPQIEERIEAKKRATLAFARANPIDRAEWGHPARFGIVTTGKAHLDTLEALRLLGIDRAQAAEIGIDLYKVGMVWPLEDQGALAFAAGKQELLVIEEKRGIIESQLKEYFYDVPGQKPQRMVGKRDEHGNRLIPWTHELGARMLAPIIAARLDRVFPGLNLGARAETLVAPPPPPAISGATRTPWFCSGCPHSTSTRVPEGSQALAGIGCHFMASWMDRNTTSLIQMGGEGVNWVARARFNGNRHIFQNLGEGTWFHSGSLAIRQAVAAGTNITYKILFNDAVAMTGGQAVDGPISVAAVAHSVRAEGVARVVVVSDQPEALDRAAFPPGTDIAHRDAMDRLQRDLREVPGVTVLIYQQMCATEKRRLRKRGKLQDPARFAVINPLVCEGCGDCSVESNCLSIEPVETEFGTKRQVNLNSCNKDFTCLNGFCPSFVTIEGGRLKTARPDRQSDLAQRLAGLPRPVLPELAGGWDILVTGVGGTGVVTVGQLIAMAAHLEGKGASALDFMGFAQKFGPVLSYLRLGADPAALHQARIEPASADALIGCDLVVSSSPKAMGALHRGTRAVVNTAPMPTGDMMRDRDASLKPAQRLALLARQVDGAALRSLDANALAEGLLGDSVFANVLMLGAAWQAGLVPLGLAALERAIELNGVQPDRNKAAFAWGRIAAQDPEGVARLAGKTPAPAPTPEQGIDRRADFLTRYQNAALAARYRATLAPLIAAEGGVGPLSHLAAQGLFRLMAVKDEYEVARLHTQPQFAADLAQRFEGDYRIVHHMAPPLLPAARDARGRPRKRAFGPWVRPLLRALAALRPLRGTWADPFGHTAERRDDREALAQYSALIGHLARGLSDQTRPEAERLLALADQIRGYGPVRHPAMQRALAEWRAANARLAGQGVDC